MYCSSATSTGLEHRKQELKLASPPVAWAPPLAPFGNGMMQQVPRSPLRAAWRRAAFSPAAARSARCCRRQVRRRHGACFLTRRADLLPPQRTACGQLGSRTGPRGRLRPAVGRAAHPPHCGWRRAGGASDDTFLPCEFMHPCIRVLFLLPTQQTISCGHYREDAARTWQQHRAAANRLRDARWQITAPMGFSPDYYRADVIFSKLHTGQSGVPL